MNMKALTAAPKVPYGAFALLASFAIVFLAAAIFAPEIRFVMGLIGGALLLFVLFMGLAVMRAEPPIVLTADRIRCRIETSMRDYTWDDLMGVELREWPLGAAAFTHQFAVYFTDGAVVTLLGQWVGAERVAASLQAGRFDPEAKLDATDRIVMQGATVLEAPPRPLPAIALRVSRARLERWLDVAEREFGGVDRRMLRAEGPLGTYELFSMARATIGAPEVDWEARIHAYRVEVDDAHRRGSEVVAEMASWDVARAHLRLQIHLASRIEPGVPSVDLGAGILGVLVFDHESGVTSVPATTVAGWNVDESAWATAAKSNLRFPDEGFDWDAPTPILQGEGVAALVSVLDRVVDAPFGALVGIPAQDALFVLPLNEPGDALRLIAGMPATIAAVHRDTSRPVSDDVFWWRAGRPLQRLEKTAPLSFVLPRELQQFA